MRKRSQPAKARLSVLPNAGTDGTFPNSVPVMSPRVLRVLLLLIRAYPRNSPVWPTAHPFGASTSCYFPKDWENMKFTAAAALLLTSIFVLTDAGAQHNNVDPGWILRASLSALSTTAH